jgi:hypothetical protein
MNAKSIKKLDNQWLNELRGLADAIEAIHKKKADLRSDEGLKGVRRSAIFKHISDEEELPAKQALITFISARFSEFHVVDEMFKPNRGNRLNAGKEKDLVQFLRATESEVIERVQYVDHIFFRKSAKTIWNNDGTFQENWWNVIMKIFRDNWGLVEKQILKNAQSRKTPLVYLITLLTLLDLGMIPRNPKKVILDSPSPETLHPVRLIQCVSLLDLPDTSDRLTGQKRKRDDIEGNSEFFI